MVWALSIILIIILLALAITYIKPVEHVLITTTTTTTLAYSLFPWKVSFVKEMDLNHSQAVGVSIQSIAGNRTDCSIQIRDDLTGEAKEFTLWHEFCHCKFLEETKNFTKGDYWEDFCDEFAYNKTYRKQPQKSGIK